MREWFRRHILAAEGPIPFLFGILGKISVQGPRNNVGLYPECNQILQLWKNELFIHIFLWLFLGDPAVTRYKSRNFSDLWCCVFLRQMLTILWCYWRLLPSTPSTNFWTILTTHWYPHHFQAIVYLSFIGYQKSKIQIFFLVHFNMLNSRIRKNQALYPNIFNYSTLNLIISLFFKSLFFS